MIDKQHVATRVTYDRLAARVTVHRISVHDGARKLKCWSRLGQLWRLYNAKTRSFPVCDTCLVALPDLERYLFWLCAMLYGRSENNVREELTEVNVCAP